MKSPSPCRLERTGRAARRAGITLLEVIIALAIFLFSFVAIGHLVSSATERAVRGQLQQEAAYRAQSKMAEIAAGAEQMTSQSDVPFAEDPDWTWSADCNSGVVTGLWNVQVRVGREMYNGSRVEAAVTQMVLDPSARGSTTDNPNAINPSSSSSSGSSSSSTGTSSSGSSSSSGGSP